MMMSTALVIWIARNHLWPCVNSPLPNFVRMQNHAYAIASRADGEFVVHFDYAELKDLLRTNGVAQLLPRGQ